VLHFLVATAPAQSNIASPAELHLQLLLMQNRYAEAVPSAEACEIKGCFIRSMIQRIGVRSDCFIVRCMVNLQVS
jgi:hypothetical protein